jgi:DNA polymerase V
MSEKSQNSHDYSQLWVGQLYELSSSLPLALPLFLTAVSAGFPSPADDHLDCKLDLNAYLIQHPHATFLTRVEGDSMIEAGIHSGDLLIVDRALDATHGRVVIAAIEGELTVKRLVKRRGQVYLQAANSNYPPMMLHEQSNCTIMGVVVYAIHPVK